MKNADQIETAADRLAAYVAELRRLNPGVMFSADGYKIRDDRDIQAKIVYPKDANNERTA